MTILFLTTRSEFRYWEKFSNERFLSVKLDRSEYDHPGVKKFCRKKHTIIGRQYELMVTRRKKTHFELIFFATGGDGLTDISVSEARDWHFPRTEKNRATTIAKYMGRFDLAFSDVSRTVVIDPGDIEYHEDLQNEDGTVMSDGCSGISSQLLEQICGKLESVVPAHKFRAGDIPSAIQVRLGPNKGIFYKDQGVAAGKVVVRPSMHKYDIPNPSAEQCCIEVNNWAPNRAQCGKLNRQVCSAAKWCATSVFAHASNMGVRNMS